MSWRAVLVALAVLVIAAPPAAAEHTRLSTVEMAAKNSALPLDSTTIIRNDPVALSGFLDEFATTDGRLLVRRGDLVQRDGNDLFVPAGWVRHKEIVAYSGAGYESRTRQPVHGTVTLTLPSGAAVSIVPAGTRIG